MPPKPPGQIPDPELPREPETPRRTTKRDEESDAPDPAESIPRVSPATRRPRPKEKPYEEDAPDEVE